MKSLKLLFMLMALGFGACGAGSNAWADRDGRHEGAYHHGGHGGWPRTQIGIGIGYWDPWFYSPFYYPYPPVYYPRTVVIEQPAPMVYIERPENLPDADQEADGSYWYYCRDSKTYYPYVKECRSAWQRVVPKPPAPR